MPLTSLRAAAPDATRATATTTAVLRHLDARQLSDLLVALAPALAGASEVALLAEARDGRRVSGTARELLAGTAASLLLLTTDRERPAWVDELTGPTAPGGGRVAWASTAAAADVVTAVLGAPAAGPDRISERSRHLLAELLAFWESLGLTRLDDVVVVASRTAWPEYLDTSALVTAPGRGLRGGTTHVGFYVDDAIAEVVPAIERTYPAVRFTPAEAAAHRRRGDAALARVIERSLEAGTRTEGATHAVLLLTGPGHEGTVRLQGRLVDDATSASGRRTAWTTSQRYTAVERLRSGAAATSQL